MNWRRCSIPVSRVRQCALAGLAVLGLIAGMKPTLAQAPPDPARMLSTLNEVRRETRRLREQGQRNHAEMQREVRSLRQQVTEGEQRESDLQRRLTGLERRSVLTTLIGAILLLAVALLAARRRAPSVPMDTNSVAALRQPVSDLDRRLQRLEAGLRESSSHP